MNWLTAICTYIWLTKERIKAARMRRKTARICRDVDRSIERKRRTKPKQFRID